jgi:hypothetical protein
MNNDQDENTQNNIDNSDIKPSYKMRLRDIVFGPIIMIDD